MFTRKETECFVNYAIDIFDMVDTITSTEFISSIRGVKCKEGTMPVNCNVGSTEPACKMAAHFLKNYEQQLCWLNLFECSAPKSKIGCYWCQDGR